jgi:hypothetical protein
MAEIEDTGKLERGRATVRRWYHNHADEYNEARRKKYASDDGARERARQRAREYRARRRNGAEPLSNEPLFRFVNKDGPCPYGEGVRIPVYTTGQVAAYINSTPQMLRNWERKGWIPASSFPDKHRLYTKNQAFMIVSLAEFMIGYRKSPKINRPALVGLLKKIKAQWESAYDGNVD